MNEYFKIDNMGLMISVFAMFIVMLISSLNHLKLSKEIFIGTLRSFFQLFLMGFVLKYTFQHSHWYYTFSLLIMMILFATYEAYKRIKIKNYQLFQYILFALTIGSLIPLSVIFYLVIKIKPWYNIQFIIPISGMIVANSMTALSLGLRNFLQEIETNRLLIETKLSLGATSKNSIKPIFQKSYYNGILPSINSLMVLGIAKLPGMMTGQILAGVSPLESVKYQLMIMYMISFSTALSLLILLELSKKIVFNQREQIII